MCTSLDTWNEGSIVPHREFARCAVCGRDIARWQGMWDDAGGWWHLDDDVAHDHRASVIPPKKKE